MNWKRVGFGLVLLVVFGCGGGGGSVSVPDPVMRFLNASPNAVGVDFAANEASMGTNVPYLGSTPTFVSFDPGEYDIATQANGDPFNGDTQVYTMDKNTDHLTVAVGIVNPPADEMEKRLRGVSFAFERTKPNESQARIVLVHGIVEGTGLQTPFIDFRNPGDNPRYHIDNVEFGGSRGFLIDAGPQTFVARRSGSELEVTPQNTFTFQGGKIYAALVCGVVGDPTRPAEIHYVELQTR